MKCMHVYTKHVYDNVHEHIRTWDLLRHMLALVGVGSLR